MDIINKLNKKGNVTMEDILYHGSKMIVSEPEIRKSRFTNTNVKMEAHTVNKVTDNLILN